MHSQDLHSHTVTAGRRASVFQARESWHFFQQAEQQKFWGSFVDFRFWFLNWLVPIFIMIIDTYCHWIEVPVQFGNPIHQSKQPLQVREFRWKTKLFLAWEFSTQLSDSKSWDRPKINVGQMSRGDNFGCVVFKICATMAQKHNLGRTLHIVSSTNI